MEQGLRVVAHARKFVVRDDELFLVFRERQDGRFVLNDNIAVFDGVDVRHFVAREAVVAAADKGLIPAWEEARLLEELGPVRIL